MPPAVVSSAGHLALLASRIRFEEKALLSALERGGFVVDVVDPRTLVMTAGSTWTGPLLALNREIGQVRALYAASALEAAGVTMVNTAQTTRVSGDKWHTTTALLGAGVPTPRTALAATTEAGLEALQRVGYPAVIKPLVGSWGRLVTRVSDPATAAAVLEHVAALPSPQSHMVYVQEEIPHIDRDIRVVVVGGRALGATYRRSTQWRSNVARGAISEPCALSDDLTKHAEAAAAAVGAEIAGVDVLECVDGSLTVLEVNDRVEFRGFQQAHGSGIDVARAIVDHLKTRACT